MLMRLSFHETVGTIRRSAEWHSAVSPTGSRQGVRFCGISQIANLRYGRLPVCATKRRLRNR